VPFDRSCHRTTFNYWACVFHWLPTFWILILILILIIVVFAQVPSFTHYDIFHFSSCLFKQAAVSFCFLSCNVSHSKQAAATFSFPLSFSAVSVYPLPRSQILLLICFFLSLLYIKPLFPIKKQLSIDSSLNWEGHHWDIRSTRLSCHHLQFPPSAQLFSTLLTSYDHKCKPI